MDKKTVVVGMSGGVDSSVTAYLLKEQGYNVVGLFMKNWEETDANGSCTAEQDYADVRRVCAKIGIPYYTVNFSKEYMDNVFASFIADFEKGRTPNPDVLCNREVKFKPFLKFAKSIGADYIATGHYAQIRHIDSAHYLLRAVDENKDQTYFLNQLSQQQLQDVLFPVGHLTKPEVREIARAQGLINADKKDSTGICFIGERKFREFLKNYIPSQAGDICTLDGKVIGQHDGSMYYTIGQRRGLGVGGQKGDTLERWFVVDKDIKKNIVYVSHDEKLLLSRALIACDFNFIPSIPSEKTFKCMARYRHRQALFSVTATILENGNVRVDFDAEQRAVNVGQFVVLYDGEKCLGGGYILSVEK